MAETSPSPAGLDRQLEDLVEFRACLYRCFPSWGDALFELGDALLGAPGAVGSVPALSLEPVFRRSHGSLYKALARGDIDAEAMRALLVATRPQSWPLVFAVDASTWERPDAETSPERGFYYSASKHSAGQPIAAGWSYQWIAQLNWEANSWTAPLDALRIAPTADATTSTVGQLKALVALLPNDGAVPVFVLDAGYDPAGLAYGLSDTRAQVVVRIRDDRVFYAEAPKGRPGRPKGRPRRHGRRFKCSDARTYGRPDDEVTISDPRYGTIRARAWHNLHPRLSRRGQWSEQAEIPIVAASVIRVDVDHLPKSDGRVKKVLWLWWSGPGEPDLEMCVKAYLHRFDVEHTYRFAKNTLGWTAPCPQSPHQADRWTWLIIAAYTQLRLARSLVEDMRMPWERRRAPGKLTPARVRRGFRRLGTTIGTPASPPKSNKAGPGRPKGTTRPRRTRHPVVKKAA
ncbi:MAG TPA: NF041680 family putative transposase [Acidimicrobiales bacterium]|nr:NF041680 family putative transposase [Acidimicrobiales bacterium]